MNSRSIDSPNIELLIQLINLYIKTVLLFSSKLSSFLQLDKLTDWRSLGIPIQGKFDDGWSYAFHGSGCIIYSPNMEVDFEFDKDCQIGGFDVWRLWSFVCDNEKVCDEFSEFADKKRLQAIFDIAIENHTLKQKGSLYHLVD